MDIPGGLMVPGGQLVRSRRPPPRPRPPSPRPPLPCGPSPERMTQSHHEITLRAFFIHVESLPAGVARMWRQDHNVIVDHVESSVL